MPNVRKLETGEGRVMIAFSAKELLSLLELIYAVEEQDGVLALRLHQALALISDEVVAVAVVEHLDER